MPADKQLFFSSNGPADSTGVSGPANCARWRRYHSFYGRHIVADCLDWLLEQGSLTQRLKQACGCRPFRVKLLGESYRYATLDEAHVLGIPNGVRVLVREVQLLCEEIPWVFARSLIPVTSLKGSLQRLKRQGSRSLGATLFADQSLRRGPLEIHCINATEIPVEMDPRRSVSVWGRRSVFYVQNRPLLVSEYFLPALFKNTRMKV